MVEMMAGQGDDVRAILAETRQYRDVQIDADLAGLDRFALAFKR
jgi:release factor glutamine methyltransferase